MTTMELLTWARGDALEIAATIFFVGMVFRVVTIFLLGRKKDLSEARVENSGMYGLRTIFARSLPDFKHSDEPVALISGYLFHIGFFMIVLLYVPHIMVFKGAFGISWPGLPFWLIDGVTLITLASMLVVLWYRYTNPVRRYLSTFGDWFSWLVTFLPILTGYLVYHRLLLPYNEMLFVHIMTVNLLLVSFPFTKLTHFFTLFIARYYNGQMAGRKGVKA